MQKNKLRKTSLILVFLFSIGIFSPASTLATTTEEQLVIDYLRNWSYVENECTYVIIVDRMSAEDLAEYLEADYDQLDSLLYKNLVQAFKDEPTYVSAPRIEPTSYSGITPLAQEQTAGVYTTLDFWLNGVPYYRELGFYITANVIRSSGKITSVSGPQLHVITGDHLKFLGASHRSTVFYSTSVQVNFFADFSSQIGLYNAYRSVTLTDLFYNR